MTMYPIRDLTIFGDADDKTVQQMNNCLDVQSGAKGVLCADNHLGYAQPVGGVVAYRDRISVSGVGYDIGCGNKAVKTNVHVGDLKKDGIVRVMDEIERRVAFGIGPNPGEKAPDHPVLESIRSADFAPQRNLIEKAANQLGTVGGGNHYVDLFEDEDGWLWVGVHFGSRGFGHTTANGFMHMAQGRPFQTKGAAEVGLMDAPITFNVASAEGEAYIAAMTLAGQYAYAGRDVVVDRVLDILDAEATWEVHNHHNFAWTEVHFGEQWCVVRKGATPAFPGQYGFVGSTMGEDSVILRGAEAPLMAERTPARCDLQEAALFSTVHGAGRAMSRTRAAGKQRKRWACNNRDCDWVQPPHTHKPEDGKCPKCKHPRLSKQWVQISAGEIDWHSEYHGVVDAGGVELRGGGAEEAPGAYKRLPEVLAAMGGTIEVVHTLHPIGVAMAPNGVPADD